VRREEYSESFTFGPIERQGLVGSLRLSQAGILIVGCAIGVALVRALPAGRGLLLAIVVVGVACGIAFATVRGRTVEQWLPVIIGWVLLRGRSGHAYRSPQPSIGVTARLDGTDLLQEPDLPEALSGCEILRVPVDGGHEIGVLRDPMLGALTAVLAVRVRAFGLLAEADQERRLDRWGRVLAGLARNDSVVRRVCVLERTVPSDGDELQRYLVEARDRALPNGDRALRSYETLLQAAGDVTQDHELFIGLQVDERRASGRGRRVRHADSDSPLDVACAVLVREVLAFATRFDPRRTS